MKCKSLSFTIEFFLIRHITSFSELSQHYTFKVNFLPRDFNPIFGQLVKSHGILIFLFLNIIAYLLFKEQEMNDRI